MRFSTIDETKEIGAGRIRCFETAEGALEHARETGAIVYDWGYPLKLQLELDLKKLKKFGSIRIMNLSAIVLF